MTTRITYTQARTLAQKNEQTILNQRQKYLNQYYDDQYAINMKPEQLAGQYKSFQCRNNR